MFLCMILIVFSSNARIIIENGKGELQKASGKERRAYPNVTWDIAEIGSMTTYYRSYNGRDLYDPLSALQFIDLWERESGTKFDKALANIMGDQLPDNESKAFEFDEQEKSIPLYRGNQSLQVLQRQYLHPQPTNAAQLLCRFRRKYLERVSQVRNSLYLTSLLINIGFFINPNS